jgi:hypothetical protein
MKRFENRLQDGFRHIAGGRGIGSGADVHGLTASGQGFAGFGGRWS